MDEQLKQNGNYLKNLSIIHLALLIGQVMFLAVVAVLHKTGYMKPTMDLGEIVNYAVIAMCIAILLIGGIVVRSRMSAVKQLTTLDSKLEGYMAVLIMQFAIICGTSMFSTTWFLVSGSRWIIYFGTFNIVFFFMLRPTADKVRKELDLSADEMSGLGNPV